MAMEADEWIRRQAKAKDEVYDLINKGGTDNLLRAVDVAWLEYTNFTQPLMMTAGRKAMRSWDGLAAFAKRMVIDAACALAYERSKAPH
jgi:hypothetical protein